MLNLQNKRKIKNDKICCWRLELPSYSFYIVFRPDEDNIVANTFSRVYCLAINTDALQLLHNSLGHPGIMWMLAFILPQNLPFSVDDVCKMTKSCQICNECKPCKNIFACLFNVHDKISLSGHQQVCLIRLRFERYFSHHQAM